MADPETSDVVTSDVAVTDPEALATDAEAEALEGMLGDSPFLAGSPSIGDFVNPEQRGIVLDEAVAREAPCIGYELRGRGAGPDLVFAKGIEGPLSEDQVEMFCSDIRIRDVSPDQLERLSAFRESAELCSEEVDETYDRGDRLEPYLSCMSRELRERGQPF